MTRLQSIGAAHSYFRYYRARYKIAQRERIHAFRCGGPERRSHTTSVWNKTRALYLDSMIRLREAQLA